MKISRLLLAVLLCTGLCIAFGVSSCGDDDEGGDARCDAACKKIISCAADFSGPVDMTLQECISGCNENIDAQARCAFACDRDAECPDYAECIEVDCGLTFD